MKISNTTLREILCFLFLKFIEKTEIWFNRIWHSSITNCQLWNRMQKKTVNIVKNAWMLNQVFVIVANSLRAINKFDLVLKFKHSMCINFILFEMLTKSFISFGKMMADIFTYFWFWKDLVLDTLCSSMADGVWRAAYSWATWHNFVTRWWTWCSITWWTVCIWLS